MSTMWGQNPTILACGHLCDPIAGSAWRDGEQYRECLTCGREDEDKRWQRFVTAPDLDFGDSAAAASGGE